MKPLILFLPIVLFMACKPVEYITDADKSRFIIRATVENIGAANLPEITDVSNCIVAKVNEVISAPPGFEDWTGKSITIAVNEPGRQKKGSEMVFYTNGWLYGRSIAVVEVSSRNSRDVSNQEILKEVNDSRDNKVRERLKKSEIVVSGMIIKVGDAEKQPTDSEHDPFWKNAEIEVDSYEKGNLEEKTITIRFASSFDVMWENSPKFKQGDKGIWLLRRSADKTSVYILTEREDFYTSDRLEYIRSLLK